MSAWADERHKRDDLVGRRWIYDSDRPAVPTRINRLDQVRQKDAMLIGHHSRQRRADRGLRNVAQFLDAILLIDAIHALVDRG